MHVHVERRQVIAKEKESRNAVKKKVHLRVCTRSKKESSFRALEHT